MNFQFEKNKLYNYLGKDLVELLKKHKCFIAGGTLTSLFCNREINDIDVYFRDEKSAIDFLKSIWEDNEWITALTNKACLIQYGKTKFEKIDVQLIYFNYFQSTEEIFNTFDFTTCMGAYDFEKDDFVLHEDFLKHNSQRLLKFNSSTAFPIVSMLRVQKYQEKGYTISKPEFIRIILTCMNLDINTYDELKEQLGGMYGINYDKLFEDVKDKEFDLQEAIDKIADINLSEDYFTIPDPVNLDDIEDIVECISKTPVKYFKHNNEFYKINSEGLLVVSKIKPPNGELISGEDFFRENKFYKFVMKENDRYYSFFDKDFEYKLNEIVVAKVKKDRWGVHGGRLYFSELQDIEISTYGGRDKAVLIEVEFTFDDFMGFDYVHITTKQCKMLREVPKEEYKQYLKEIVKDDIF